MAQILFTSWNIQYISARAANTLSVTINCFALKFVSTFFKCHIDGCRDNVIFQPRKKMAANGDKCSPLTLYVGLLICMQPKVFHFFLGFSFRAAKQLRPLLPYSPTRYFSGPWYIFQPPRFSVCGLKVEKRREELAQCAFRISLRTEWFSKMGISCPSRKYW